MNEDRSEQKIEDETEHDWDMMEIALCIAGAIAVIVITLWP